MTETTQAKATRTAKVIGLWLDATTGDDLWIVSLDTMNGLGQAEGTDTLDTAADYDSARETAVEEARKRGLCVVETADDYTHDQTVAYRSLAITVCDVGMGACRGVLAGNRWDSDDSEIADLDLSVWSDEDDADDIADAVREAFIAATANMKGGDPDAEYDADANGLSVVVKPMACVID